MAETTFEWSDLIGVPFELGARGPNSYDCYGLLSEVYKRLGVAIPDLKSPKSGVLITALATSEAARVWVEVEPKPHVTALIRTPSSLHVGLLLPHDRIIHTWHNSGGVVVERMHDWRRRVIGYYEYVGS